MPASDNDSDDGSQSVSNPRKYREGLTDLEKQKPNKISERSESQGSVRSTGEIKSLWQTNKTSERSEFQGSVRSADRPIIKSQDENEMIKTENIDRLIGDVSASYDKDREVKPYFRMCHIYDILSAYTDARLGESDIQVELIKEMKKRVIELKNLYPLTKIRKIWSNKMLMNLYILEGYKQKPISNPPAKCANKDCSPRDRGSYATPEIRNKTAEDSLSD